MDRSRGRRSQRSGAKSGRPDTVAPAGGDESGCLLLVILFLWFSGFVTFHSRERGKAIARVEAATEQLDSVQGELQRIAESIAELRIEHDSLSGRQTALRSQVEALEDARERVVASLTTVDSLIAQPPASLTKRVLRMLFSGVPSGLMVAGLAALIAVLWRRILQNRRRAA